MLVEIGKRKNRILSEEEAVYYTDQLFLLADREENGTIEKD
jgi:hypothetical protein